MELSLPGLFRIAENCNTEGIGWEGRLDREPVRVRPDGALAGLRRFTYHLLDLHIYVAGGCMILLLA